MSFESLLDATNLMYDNQDMATINKRPTPVRIVRQLGGGRVEGFFEKPSTVDFDGFLQGGRAIVFEAKEVRELNRFDLKNIESHQVDYLAKGHRRGAVSFLLINFSAHRSIYLLPYITLKHFWDLREKGVRGTGSIPLSTLEVHGYVVKSGRVPVDYLPVVKQIWKLEVA